MDVRDRLVPAKSVIMALTKIYETVNRSTRLAAQGDLDTTQLNRFAVVRQNYSKSLSKLSMMP